MATSSSNDPTAAPTTPTHDTIVGLLEHSAYNPGIVPQLEAYVDAQCAVGKDKAPYYFDANRTLLKLYQFFPHLANEGYISLTLFLAIIEFPSTDGTALSCLIPEKNQSREPCATLVRSADLLETCRFYEFWPVLRQLADDATTNSGIVTPARRGASLSAVAADPATVARLRRSILSLLSLTYTTTPLAVVLSALDLKSSFALKDFLQEEGNEASAALVAEVKEGECVEFRPRKENTRRHRVFKEGVNFDSIAHMLENSSMLQ